MPTDPRRVTEDAAQALLEALAGAGPGGRVRVADAGGGLACLIQVWPKAAGMPTAREGRPRRRGRRRAGCREAVLAALRAAGRPLTRKELLRVLRDARAGHGPGTVAKALA